MLRREAAINPQTALERFRPKFLALDQVEDIVTRLHFDLQQLPGHQFVSTVHQRPQAKAVSFPKAGKQARLAGGHQRSPVLTGKEIGITPLNR